jgi:hypothetical protein
VIDHALTRPWTIDKRYVRNGVAHPDWPESICPEYNAQIFIGSGCAARLSLIEVLMMERALWVCS